MKNINVWGRVLISAIVTTGFMSILILVITTKTGGNATPEVLLVMLGSLGAAFGQVVSYWVGSSSGSTTKDTSIENLSTKVAVDVPTNVPVVLTAVDAEKDKLPPEVPQ